MLKLTEGQVRFICNHTNPYTKVIGFLYIRFLCDPQELWDRLNDYTANTQTFEIKPGTSISIGQFVEKLLIDQDFYGLQLPRIPVSIQTILNKKCSQLAGRRQRLIKNIDKEFENNSNIFVYLDDIKPGVFKHKDGNKVHVQVEGKDLHLSIGDIDDQYSCISVISKPSLSYVTDSRKEYMKKALSYKDALMYQIPSKRPRSPSPEVINITTEHEPEKSKTELYSLEAPSNKKYSDNAGPDYLKLG